jgi:hypothetical protein
MIMRDDRIDYRALSQQVDEDVQKQKRMMRVVFFGISTFMLGLFTVLGFGMSGELLASMNPDTADQIRGAITMMMMGGFMGVLFQGIMLGVDSKAGEASMREQATARALSRELMRLSAEDAAEAEKPKRQVRLTDDGELEEVPIEDTQDVTLTLRKRT